MRFFHILFGVYILVLSSLACSDVESAGHKSASQISTGQPADPHEDETCSPFCVCSCCGSMAVHFCSKPLEKSPEVLTSISFCSPGNHITEISSSIWQPPKITC